MSPQTCLINKEIKQIQAEILPGEILLWSGRESHLRYWFSRSLKIIGWGLFMILMGIFSANFILLNPDFLKHSLNNILPVLIPIFLTFLGGFFLFRALLHPQKSQPDLYALTGRRALILRVGQDIKTFSYGPETVHSAQIRRRKNGSGDIIFERSKIWIPDKEGRATRQVKNFGFYGLRDVDETTRYLALVGQPDLTVMKKGNER
jgi:hypothetical protein